MSTAVRREIWKSWVKIRSNVIGTVLLLSLLKATYGTEESNTISLFASPTLVGNVISYCPLYGDSGGGSGRAGGGASSTCAITCVVSVGGIFPISPHFELNGTRYTVQGIKATSVAVIDHNDTVYTLTFPCSPLTFQCYLEGDTSSRYVTVSPDASRCITATSVNEISSSSATTVGQTSDGDLVYITSGSYIMETAMPDLYTNETNNGTLPHLPIGWILGGSVIFLVFGCVAIIGIILCCFYVSPLSLLTVFGCKRTLQVSRQAMDDSSGHRHGYCPGVRGYWVPPIREESPSSDTEEVLIDVMMSEDSSAKTEPSELVIQEVPERSQSPMHAT